MYHFVTNFRHYRFIPWLKEKFPGRVCIKNIHFMKIWHKMKTDIRGLETLEKRS